LLTELVFVPGHHAAHDSFGGYCYVNHVAALARHLQQRQHPSSQQGNCRVAILDVDYHCGNGTASIFYDDPRVLVVSLHCHPDHDYPFHSGFADETGTDSAKGTTLHLPMAPGMEWPNYKVILERGLAKVRNFDPAVCLLSLGLDTHENDPCAIRRAGFKLKTDDYLAMGRTISRNLPGVPLVIVQEGGYLMSKVGEAAANLVLGCCTPGSGTASRSASLVSSSEVAK
jgi:acetoin utilization deacetylase AcuC-like enzyme